MITIEDLEHAAHETTNSEGKPVIEIPRDLWDEWRTQQGTKSQADRIREALSIWDQSAEALSEEWWNEFQDFLKHNRLNLT